MFNACDLQVFSWGFLFVPWLIIESKGLATSASTMWYSVVETIVTQLHLFEEQYSCGIKTTVSPWTFKLRHPIPKYSPEIFVEKQRPSIPEIQPFNFNGDILNFDGFSCLNHILTVCYLMSRKDCVSYTASTEHTHTFTFRNCSYF